jgi:rhodanese-related sulfurtransferase
MPDSVTREEVQTLVRNGSQLIEVLGAHQYARAHLAGAINIPLAQIDHKSTATLSHERPVIVYSNDFLCDLSPRAAWRLESLGFANVCDYVAGKEDWLAYGLPIEGELAEAVTVGQLAVPGQGCHSKNRT